MGVGPDVSAIEVYCKSNGLIAPAGLKTAHTLSDSELDGLLYRPGLDPSTPPSIEWARNTAATSPWPMPQNLVPLLPLDDQSFACVVAAPLGRSDLSGAGMVVRWHLGVSGAEHQATVVDTDAGDYVRSVAEELRARPQGLARMLDEIGPAYELDFLEKAKRPRDFVIRPVRIACQNVIVGLAAFAHDSGIDGMSVVAWQTCEVPHVATHEGNRGLAALMLCDAYRSGGTMEIRFDRPARLSAEGVTQAGKPVRVNKRYRGHPEMSVPASLRRYGRSVGVELGADDPAGISPTEARNLFQAVTPMPFDLKHRVEEAVSAGMVTPESLCFSLLAPVWRDIELDFILATSGRVASILSGGAEWTDRSARQAETEVCRAAVMLGMLFRRLNATDTAAADGSARLVEDVKVGVEWTILPRLGAVRFTQLQADCEVPWTRRRLVVNDALTVFARAFVSEEVIAQALSETEAGLTALVVPNGAVTPSVPDPIVLMRCPDRLMDIDKTIESKLLQGRVSRG